MIALLAVSAAAPLGLAWAHDNVQHFTDGDNCGSNTVGHEHRDVFHMKAGLDCAHLGEGNDDAFGAEGRDELTGRGDNDDLFGGEHDDDLYGYNGVDELEGGLGADYLSGAGGEDFHRGENGDDVISAIDNTPDDHIQAGAQDDDWCHIDVMPNDNRDENDGCETIVRLQH